MTQINTHLHDIESGLSALALNLSEEQVQKLNAYLQLLFKWNQTYNLTAIRESHRMVSHHILDSLSLVPHLSGFTRLLDVGSGGGMPGILVAIAKPDLQVVVLDSNHKKTTFLRQAVMELDLKNVEVITSRVELYQPEQGFDVITSRAFSELAEFVRLTPHLLTKDGVYLAMKGVHPYEEIASLPQDIKVESVLHLQVPSLEAERHLVKMVRV